MNLWKAIGLIHTTGDNYYLIQEIGYPLYYNISNTEFKNKYNSIVTDNKDHFADIYINNKFILKTKEPIVYSSNNEHNGLYISISIEEYLKLVKEGIFEYPWEIRIA